MDINKELESINIKYTELVSKAWNNTKDFSIDKFFNEVLPNLEKEKQKEIENLKTKILKK